MHILQKGLGPNPDCLHYQVTVRTVHHQFVSQMYLLIQFESNMLI